jgi:cupin fold WbuC family metalloprotein
MFGIRGEEGASPGNPMITINPHSLDTLCAEARANPRRRRNLNIHSGETAPSQRLFNALEPDSYVAPHRHADPAKDETFVWIRGRLGVVEFTPDGRVAEVAELSAGTAVSVTIPSGTFHTIFALEPGSIFFESKAGPYRPLSADEKAPWAPPEGSPESATYLAGLAALLAGDPR